MTQSERHSVEIGFAEHENIRNRVANVWAVCAEADCRGNTEAKLDDRDFGASEIMSFGKVINCSFKQILSFVPDYFTEDIKAALD